MDRKLEAQLWTFSHLLIVTTIAQSVTDYRMMEEGDANPIIFGGLFNGSNHSAEKKKGELLASNIYLTNYFLCMIDDMFPKNMKIFLEAEKKLGDFYIENLSGKLSADTLFETKEQIKSLSQEDFVAWIPLLPIAFNAHINRMETYPDVEDVSKFSRFTYEIMYETSIPLLTSVNHIKSINASRKLIVPTVNALCERLSNEQIEFDKFK